MSAQNSIRKSRRRGWLPVFAVVILIFAGLGVNYLIQPERLGARLIRRAEAASGLKIELSSPARLSLWPRLNLQLDGVTVANPADLTTLLRAERVEVALPLAVLWSAEPAIGRVDLHRADIDFEAVSEWLGVDGEVGPPATLRLPAIAVQLVFTESTLRVAGLTLSNLELDVSAVRAGLPATLFASAGNAEAGANIWHLRAEATPRQHEDGIAVEAIRVTLAKQGDSQELATLTGTIALQLPQRLRMQLVLKLMHPEQLALPTLPAEIQTRLTQPFALVYNGADDLSDELNIQTGGGEYPLTITTHVHALAAWAKQDARGAKARDPLPPMQGSAALPRFEVDGVLVEGLQVEIKASDPTPESLGSGERRPTENGPDKVEPNESTADEGKP